MASGRLFTFIAILRGKRKRSVSFATLSALIYKRLQFSFRKSQDVSLHAYTLKAAEPFEFGKGYAVKSSLHTLKSQFIFDFLKLSKSCVVLCLYNVYAIYPTKLFLE